MNQSLGWSVRPHQTEGHQDSLKKLPHLHFTGIVWCAFQLEYLETMRVCGLHELDIPFFFNFPVFTLIFHYIFKKSLRSYLKNNNNKKEPYKVEVT